MHTNLNRKLTSLILLFFLLVSVGALRALSAGTAPEAITEPAILPQLVILADPTEPLEPLYLPAPAEISLEGPQTASIQVNYIGSWDPQAQAAFEYAKNLWQSQITSAVTIKIDARWEPLGSGILGGTSWAGAFVNFPGATRSNTAYPYALANKLAGSDLDPTRPDMYASFNSTFTGWYFSTSGVPPSGKYDFVSVVLHEITHGLGFAGSMQVGTPCGNSAYGCWGFSSYPAIYDWFAVRGDNVSLLNTGTFPNPSAALKTVLTGNNVYYNGTQARAANGGNNVKLFAPAAWSSGSSYAHLDEIYNGTSNALMTYSLAPREVLHDPGPITRGMLGDMGWTVGGTQATPTPTVWPTPHVFTRLPLISLKIAAFNITGKVTQNGSAVTGVPVALIKSTGSTLIQVASTTTNSGGNYSFPATPSLNGSDAYFVQYRNSSNTSGRLYLWNTSRILSNPATTQVTLPTFDIADVVLSAPLNGSTVSLPYTFAWQRRAHTSSDSYEFDIYDPADGSPWWYTAHLGYVSSYALSSPPSGFAYNVPYRWEVWVYAPGCSYPNGCYGISRQAWNVTFSAAAGQTQPGLAPSDSTGRDLPLEGKPENP